MRRIKQTQVCETPDGKTHTHEVEGRSGFMAVWIPDNMEEADTYPHTEGNVQIVGGGYPLEEVAILKALRKRTIERAENYLRHDGGTEIERKSIINWLAEEAIREMVTSTEAN